MSGMSEEELRRLAKLIVEGLDKSELATLIAAELYNLQNAEKSIEGLPRNKGEMQGETLQRWYRRVWKLDTVYAGILHRLIIHPAEAYALNIHDLRTISGLGDKGISQIIENRHVSDPK
jgi:hypothetical protein